MKDLFTDQYLLLGTFADGNKIGHWSLGPRCGGAHTGCVRGATALLRKICWLFILLVFAAFAIMLLTAQCTTIAILQIIIQIVVVILILQFS